MGQKKKQDRKIKKAESRHSRHSRKSNKQKKQNGKQQATNRANSIKVVAPMAAPGQETQIVIAVPPNSWTAPSSAASIHSRTAPISSSVTPKSKSIGVAKYQAPKPPTSSSVLAKSKSTGVSKSEASKPLTSSSVTPMSKTAGVSKSEASKPPTSRQADMGQLQEEKSTSRYGSPPSGKPMCGDCKQPITSNYVPGPPATHVECFMKNHAKICEMCKEKIAPEKTYKTNNGVYYHAECIRCTACEEPIDKFYNSTDPNSYKCVKCLGDTGATDCFKCGRPLAGKPIVMTGKKRKHAQCATCDDCGQPLKDVCFIVNDKSYCSNCKAKNLKTCDKCQKEIHGKMISANQLDIHLHYACFKCSVCKKEFDGKQYYKRDNKLDFICSNCNNKLHPRFKSTDSVQELRAISTDYEPREKSVRADVKYDRKKSTRTLTMRLPSTDSKSGEDIEVEVLNYKQSNETVKITVGDKELSD